MKPKVLIPFVVILAILAGMVYLKERKGERPLLSEQVGLKKLVTDDVKVSAVERVVLYASASPDETVELVRSEDGWVAASHFNAPVTETTVTEYIEKVVGLQGEPRLKAKGDDDLASFNLKDDEAFRVQLFTGGEEPAVDLLVGKSPDFRTVFLRKAGDMQVFVEATNPRREAGVSAEDMATAPKADKWLDKNVIALEDTGAVTKVALAMPGKSLTFEQVEVEQPAPEETEEDSEGEQTPPEPIVVKEWKVAEGGGDMAMKANALTTYTGRFRNYAATNIVDPAKKEEYGLDNPTYRATISVEGEEDIVIEGARPEADGNGYLRVASSDKDLVYEVSSFAFGNLFPKGNTLFDLPKLTLAQDEVTQVTITSDKGRVVANKADGAWTLAEPATDMVVKPGPLNTLVTTLGNWTPADFAGADADTGAFDRTVEVTAAGVTRTLSLGKAQEGADVVYAKLDGVDTVLAMNQADVDKVLLGPGDVLNLDVLEIVAADVNAIDYRKGEEVMKLRRAGEGWTVAVTDGEPFEVDATAAEAFVNDVVGIEAEGARFDQAKVEGDVYLNLTVQAASGLPRFITVGVEADGKYPLAVSGKGTVFEVGKLAVDRITVKGDALKVKPEAPVEETPETEETEDAPTEDAPEMEETAEETTEAPEVTVDVSAPLEAEAAGTEEAPAEEEMKEEAPAEAAPAAEDATGEEAPAEAGGGDDDWDELSIGSMSGQAVL